MDPAGLSAEQAARQLQADGHNDVPSAERREYWRIALEMLCQPMFAMLIGGGLIYLLLGDPIEARIVPLELFNCRTRSLSSRPGHDVKLPTGVLKSFLVLTKHDE